MILSAGLLAAGSVTPVWGQGKSAKGKPAEKGTEKPSKKAKSGTTSEEDTPHKPLEELDFSAGPASAPKDGSAIDIDETPEGQERLAALLVRAKDIFKDRDKVERQRQPLVLPRDRLVGEVILLNQGIAKAQQGIQQAQNQIRNLQRQSTNNDNAQLVANEIRAQQDQIRLANQAISLSQDQISERQTDITALNIQIDPLDQRLFQLWSELNNSRKQWLEIRQPQLKYAYGHFESLKRVIDDWLLIDGLWPDAYVWAALSNYELGEYAVAWDHVEKATELRKMLQFPKAWAQGEALRGLIAAQIRERRGKSAGYLQSASIFVANDKKTSWETNFLIGRAAFENDKLAGKAKASFEKALKSRPDATCVQFWNSRLQTTTTLAAVRDVERGTKTLEAMWERSNKKSWRLSHALVLAYDAYNQDEKAKEFWDTTLKLAPETEHKGLLEARTTARNKLEAMTAGDGSTKSKEENSKSKKIKTSSK